MTFWTSGYVADLGYTHGFYRELTPQLLQLVALAKGIQYELPTDGIRYCELGCGQGFSANLLAATNPSLEIYATDFNPAHIAGAKALAAEAGTSNVDFFEQSFAESLEDSSFPQFDIISLHGIYSWIAEEHRATIVEFIRKRLKPGGLVYVSYNALPGWAAAAPLRHLMYLQGKSQGGPTAARLGPALGFVGKVNELGANYFKLNPSIGPRLEKLKTMNGNYLAHEYLNDAWTLLYFSDVAKEMSEAKLSFVGSAAFLEHIDVLNLSNEQRDFLNTIPDTHLREVTRDFITNAQFRRDVYVKGAIPHSQTSLRGAWLKMRFVLSSSKENIKLTAAGAAGEAKLHADTYEPVIEAFASGAQTVEQILSNKVIADLGWPKLIESLLILVGKGDLHPALPEKDEDRRRKQTRKFNNAVLQRARYSTDLGFLASPVMGSGLPLDRIQQLFLFYGQEKDPVAQVWQLLESLGQKVIKEGKTLETAEDNLSELREQWQNFEKKRPVLRNLGVV